MQLSSIALLGLVLGTSATHYEDPNTAGCKFDETKLTVTGVAGNFCAPMCNKKACPVDVPVGVTATPTCALTGKLGTKYCALLCTPGAATNVCGQHASCKSADQKGDGVCTYVPLSMVPCALSLPRAFPKSLTLLCRYDDEPPLPSSEHWKPIESPTYSAVNAIVDVAFEPTGKVGFAGGGKNGIGCQILKTEDSGLTWAQTFPSGVQPLEFNILVAASAASPSSAIVAGALSEHYTTDGSKFHTSSDEFLVPAQSTAVLPGGGYIMVAEGHSNRTNGVATSVDGKRWKEGGNVQLSDKYGSRYGAFPTNLTFYLTAGNWPYGSEEKARLRASGGRALTARVSITSAYETKLDLNGRRPIVVRGISRHPPSPPPRTQRDSHPLHARSVARENAYDLQTPLPHHHHLTSHVTPLRCP